MISAGKRRSCGFCAGEANAMKLPPLLPLRVFEVVSRHASIRRAADELNIDHTAVSRHLKALQAGLGIVLLKTTRSGVELTEAGKRYAAATRKALIEISTATAELNQREDTGPLVVWSKPGFATFFLMPRLAEFEKLHPRIAVMVRPSDEDPDFQADQADLQITYRESQNESIRQIELCRPDAYPVASPDWLADNPRPKTLQELLSSRLIHSEQKCWNWWFSEHGVTAPIEINGPRVWNTHLALEAAKAGQGIAVANELIAAPYLREGSLEAIDVARPRVPLDPYMLVARKDRWADPAIVCFRQWVSHAVLSARLPRQSLRGLTG